MRCFSPDLLRLDGEGHSCQDRKRQWSSLLQERLFRKARRLGDAGPAGNAAGPALPRCLLQPPFRSFLQYPPPHFTTFVATRSQVSIDSWHAFNSQHKLRGKSNPRRHGFAVIRDRGVTRIPGCVDMLTLSLACSVIRAWTGGKRGATKWTVVHVHVCWLYACPVRQKWCFHGCCPPWSN